ncbi:MAG: hypothetical protein HY813_02295 [Candidatus Portnoybacteria bacterium]|nr:hypothetical protein [Candidatus Portnoybacteria bacterium]
MINMVLAAACATLFAMAVGGATAFAAIVPRIDSVSPSVAVPGEKIYIFGGGFSGSDNYVNFVRARNPEGQIIGFIKAEEASGSYVSFVLPASAEINPPAGCLVAGRVCPPTQLSLATDYYISVINSKGGSNAIAFRINASDFGSAPPTLYKISDSERVYLIIGDTRVYIPSADAFLAAGYAFSNVVTVSAEKLDSYPLATLIKSRDSDRVYAIKDNLKILWILTAVDFENLGYNWKDIVTVSPHILASYRALSLVKTDESPDIYVLKGVLGSASPSKYRVASVEEFLAAGYKWSDVIVIRSVELAMLPNAL